MNKSETIGNLAVALVKAQAEMPVVTFDAKNPFLKYSYVTLGAIIEAAKPVLSKYGLSVTQFPISQEGRIGVTSILLHESGEYLEQTITMVPDTTKGLTAAQAAGVVITYLRRYSYAAILGIYADEDSDGANAAANEVVSKVMASGESVNIETGEIAHERTWSFEQMDALLEVTGAIPFADDYEKAKAILDLSVLPDTVTPKAIASWFNHFLKGEGENLVRAQRANEAYIKAKSKK